MEARQVEVLFAWGTEMDRLPAALSMCSVVNSRVGLVEIKAALVDGERERHGAHVVGS